MDISMQQLLAELGRLHMENLALRSENAIIREGLAVMAGPAQVEVSESESDPRGPSAPPEGESPDQVG